MCLWAMLSLAAVPRALAATIPESLRPPANQKLLFHFHGSGDQVYVCKASEGAYAWTLKAPDAKLLDQRRQVAGHHFAGPTWEANDGSSVVGKVTANMAAPEANSVPWLLLTAIRHEGEGRMSQVLSIQRLDTKGGKAPKAGCDSAHRASEVRAPYVAEYYFYGNAMQSK